MAKGAASGEEAEGIDSGEEKESGEEVFLILTSSYERRP
jgi:hypothetical protein